MRRFVPSNSGKILILHEAVFHRLPKFAQRERHLTGVQGEGNGIIRSEFRRDFSAFGIHLPDDPNAGDFSEPTNPSKDEGLGVKFRWGGVTGFFYAEE